MTDTQVTQAGADAVPHPTSSGYAAQVLREAFLLGRPAQAEEVRLAANLALAAAVGRLHQFVRSNFHRAPLELWEVQWSVLRSALLVRLGG